MPKSIAYYKQKCYILLYQVWYLTRLENTVSYVNFKQCCQVSADTEIQPKKYPILQHCLAPSPSSKYTVWKFQVFSVIQILREIKFGECKRSKIVVFAIFEPLNFVYFVNFSLKKVPKLIKIKFQSLQM